MVVLTIFFVFINVHLVVSVYVPCFSLLTASITGKLKSVDLHYLRFNYQNVFLYLLDCTVRLFHNLDEFNLAIINPLLF